MSSLDQCEYQSKLFLRSCLPPISQVINSIPAIPKFRAVPSSKPDRYKFIEEDQPNWWQLPQELRRTLLTSSEGQTFADSLAKTLPFSQAIGKQIVLPELGISSQYASAIDLAYQMLVSYLFAGDIKRWQPKAFECIWNDYVVYFDSAQATIEYFLYAPIVFMPGVPRQLSLGDGLEIRRLQADRRAQLASLSRPLAEVQVHHRIRRWAPHFFAKKYEIKKLIVNIESHDWRFEEKSTQMASFLNEEVALLRSLLNETLAVPTYAFVRDGYPRIPGGELAIDLPWQARLPRWINSPTRKDVEKYARRRAKFLKLHGSRGWESVTASMIRFAVAWENPFRSDILADIVAALEHLVVRGNTEVSYKLRTRVAYFLGTSMTEKQTIAKNLNDAYSYRSRIFHGGYVFDNVTEWETATRLKRAKGKRGNPFHDINEVHRLIYAVSSYYRRILKTMIDHGHMEIDWTALGL